MLLALVIGGLGLLLLWPALSVLYVALLYGAIGPTGFGKCADGRMNLAAQVLLTPYLIAAWANSRLWTRRHPRPDLIADEVWLGRFPSRRDLETASFQTVIDLSAELPGFPTDVSWRAIPMMDLVVPQPKALAAASRCIEESRRLGPVLVVCALGYGRSAAAVTTWLVATGRSRDVTEAAATIRSSRPNIVLAEPALAAVRAAADQS